MLCCAAQDVNLDVQIAEKPDLLRFIKKKALLKVGGEAGEEGEGGGGQG